jgi:DNA-3-methyladenine glycosylase
MGERQLTGPTPSLDGTALDRDFFDRPSDQVAPDLLGRVLVHGPVAVRLTEVEAYGEPGQDPPSHTYRGRSPRNAVMFGEPGHVYVYFTYGMHFCANLVCRPEGIGAAVLMRAGEVVAGAEVARARRFPVATAVVNGSNGVTKKISDRELARGPARLAVALGLGREHNGLDCCSGGAMRVLAGEPADPALIMTGPRTGVSTGAETPWRFWIEGDPTVSPYRAHAPRRRT